MIDMGRDLIRYAIRHIQTSVDIDPWAQEIAVEAMEKQIPKKPDMIQTDYDANIWHLYCPSCKDWIGTWNGRLKRMDMRNILNGNICPYCGRVIDCTGVSNGSLC